MYFCGLNIYVMDHVHTRHDITIHLIKTPFCLVAGIYITLEPSITPMFTKLGSNFTIKCIVKNAPEKATVRVVNIDYDDVENRNFKISKNVEMENGQPVTVVIVNKDAIESTDAGGYICIADKNEKHFNLVVTQGECTCVHECWSL